MQNPSLATIQYGMVMVWYEKKSSDQKVLFFLVCYLALIVREGTSVTVGHLVPSPEKKKPQNLAAS